MKKFLISSLFLSAIFMSSCSSNTEVKSSNEISKTNNEISSTQSKDLIGEVTVGAAASMTDAMNEIINNFTKNYQNVKINSTYASSGQLQQQIEQSAPIDLFISASQKQMKELEKKNLIDNSTKFDLLKNEVVLITPKDSDIKITSFEDLANNDLISKGDIAVGNTDSVPVGQYTKKIFEYLKLWDQVSSKANFATDVRQVLDWTVHGQVKAGIVYKTDAMLEKEKVNIVATAPEKSHEQVIYPCAVVSGSKNKDLAKEFSNYLKTKDATEVLEKFGFVPIEK